MAKSTKSAKAATAKKTFVSKPVLGEQTTQTPGETPEEQLNNDGVNPSENTPENSKKKPDTLPLVGEKKGTKETPHIKKAKELFARYPHVKVFYFAADDTGFFTENDAKNYARTLDDKTIKTVTR